MTQDQADRFSSVITAEDRETLLKAAVETYDGEKNEEGVFYGVLVPVAKEYGISASYEEFKDYMENLASTDEIMDKDELTQIAGGKGRGFGAAVCYGVGIGVGGGGGDDGGFACFVGGFGTEYGCCGEGDPYGDGWREKLY